MELWIFVSQVMVMELEGGKNPKPRNTLHKDLLVPWKLLTV